MVKRRSLSKSRLRESVGDEDLTTLREVRDRILNGPDDNIDRLTRQRDQQEAAGYPCDLVFLSDIGQYAVVRR